MPRDDIMPAHKIQSQSRGKTWILVLQCHPKAFAIIRFIHLGKGTEAQPILQNALPHIEGSSSPSLFHALCELHIKRPQARVDTLKCRRRALHCPAHTANEANLLKQRDHGGTGSSAHSTTQNHLQLHSSTP
ncbi:hypothetical protein AOLI_G00289670 [Acnodon oligacanthus]